MSRYLRPEPASSEINAAKIGEIPSITETLTSIKETCTMDHTITRTIHNWTIGRGYLLPCPA